MRMILSLTECLGRPAHTLAVGLLLLAMAVMVACTDDEDAQPATESQPAAASAAGETAAGDTPASSGPPVQVVTSTNFVADWARAVGGDRVEVFSLLAVGSDPHTFQPGARDVARVADADLVLTVGLGLEADWLEDLLHNASADESKIVALGDGVDPIEFAMAMSDDHGHEADDHHGEADDHDAAAVGACSSRMRWRRTSPSSTYRPITLTGESSRSPRQRDRVPQSHPSLRHRPRPRAGGR